MKIKRHTLLVLFTIGLCFHNLNLKSQSNQIFPENSIGVVYLDFMEDDKYTLIIRFPNSSILNLKIQRNESNFVYDIPIDIEPQNIILFDEDGELVTIHNVKNCVSRFWCENDGGLQYNPSFILEVEKKELKRALQHKNFKILGKITCFAVINFNPLHFKTFYPENGKENENIVMRGRLSIDYRAYAYKTPTIYQYYDRNVQIYAEADDSQMTNYCIVLEPFNSRRSFEIGCCGP